MTVDDLIETLEAIKRVHPSGGTARIELWVWDKWSGEAIREPALEVRMVDRGRTVRVTGAVS